MERTIVDAGGRGGARRACRGGRPRRAGAFAALGVWLLGAGGVAGQTVNPVYLDDSTRTRDALLGMPGLIAAGNVAEGVRTLQDLLETEGSRVIEGADDPDLFIDVRERVTGFLLGHAELLAAYREAQEPEARRLVDAGELERAARTRWVTRSGLEASLRLVQRDVEAGRFEAARLGLRRAEAHPDVGESGLARAGARLASLVGSYLPRPDVMAMAFRYSARAGEAFVAPEPAAWPEAARALGVSPTSAQPELAVESLDRRSQQAVRLAPESARPVETAPPISGRERPELPWVMPTVVGDLVLVNDGEYLGAWDRFTLAMRWRIRPPGGSGGVESRAFTTSVNYRQSLGQSLEDASFITAAGAVALATTGLARNGVRDGDGRVHAVEIATGRLLWSAAIEGLDPALAQGSVRGPVLVDADTVVVCVRTFVQFRRLQSVAMVGLDLHTGEARWVREVASAGTLPYRRPTAVADLGVLHEGVVYRVDELGTMAAIEAATGRTVWIRRMLSVSGPPENGEPWAMSGPVVVGDEVIVLSPDHRDLLRLDRHTGAILGRRGADVFGWPRYIVRVGDSLAAVGVQRVAVAPLADFETAAVRVTPVLPPPSVGRVVASGGVLLAPIAGGVAVIDPANPGRAFDEKTVIPLNRRGMLLVAESQLLVVDNDRLRSFLVWPEALERLRAQVEASPDDPLPALTLARLAARAGEWRLLTPSLDRCLEILERAPGEAGSGSVREDLFAFVLSTVRQSRLGAADPEVPVAPPEVARSLLTRLGRAARTPEQHLAHLMERGTAEERGERPSEACATYQQVLDEPVLSGALWAQGVRSVRGGLEATLRLERLVAGHGLGMYAAFEESARRERAALGDPATLDAKRALAERYPVATITPALWLEVARGLEGRGRRVEAVAALMRAERSGGALARAGALAEGGALPEAIGSLVVALDRLGRPGWALARLERILAEFPAMAPTVDGRAMDVEATRAELRALSDPLARLPVIGERVLPEPRLIAERLPLRPLLGDGPADAVLLLAEGSARLEFWRVGEGGLEVEWEREISGASAPALLSIDEERVLLFVPDAAVGGPGGPTIECLSRADGSLVWRTGVFGSLFAPDPDLQARFIAGQSQGATIRTPLDGLVRLDDLLATHDGQTLLLCERSGRTAAFDMVDGAVLWARRLELAQVHDAAVAGPRLVLGGAFLHPVGPDSVQMTLGPALLLLDSRTGDLLARHDDATAPDDGRALGEVRWVKITPRAVVLAGLRLGIGAMSLETGEDLWRAEGAATGGTFDAWVDDDRLWMLGQDRGLRLLSLEDGSLRAGALPTQGRTGSRRPVRLTRLERRVLLTSGRGVVLLDREGGLLGVDAIDRQDTLLPPAVGDPLVALLDAAPRRGMEAGTYRLSLVNTVSARETTALDLILGSEPSGVLLVDGHILITTSAGVTVLPTR